MLVVGQTEKEAPRVLFVDIDGTIRHGYDELGRFVNDVSDVVVFPEAVAILEGAKAGNWRVYGITNQGGIGLGHVSAHAVRAALVETIRQAKGLLDAVFVCPHSPKLNCWCRKPRPGLIYQALAYGACKYGEAYDPSQCVFVGDREEDQQAATAAGMPFVLAERWRRGAGVG